MSAGSKQVFNLEQVYVQIGDQYGEFLSALHLPLLDPSASLDEEMVFRLALVTTFQYAEGLPDLSAAQGTVNRRDWRYALHLPDRHPGVTAPMLCRFRASMYFSTQAATEFQQLLSGLKKIGLFSVQDMEAEETEKVVARVCGIVHFTEMKRSMKAALSSLAASDPDWLRTNAQPHWYERYRTGRLDQPVELSAAEMQKEAVRLGSDIQYLLDTLRGQDMSWLVQQAEIQVLARILESEYIVCGDQMTWRPPTRATCSCIGLGLNRPKYPP